jgi:hypothetical protein
MKRYFLAATAAAAAAFAATPASAAVCIGIAVNGGAISNVGCDGGTGSASYVSTSGPGGYLYNIGGTGAPALTMPQLLTQSINIQQANAANAIIDVYVTQSDLTSLNSSLLSAFTSNTLQGLASATISSYYSTTNALFGGTLLQSSVFNGTGVFTGANALNVTGPWSETVRYSLNFNGGVGSNFNGTANLRAVPEPATWAMMLLGFGGIGFAMRRRRQPTLAQVA